MVDPIPVCYYPVVMEEVICWLATNHFILAFPFLLHSSRTFTSHQSCKNYRERYPELYAVQRIELWTLNLYTGILIGEAEGEEPGEEALSYPDQSEKVSSFTITHCLCVSDSCSNVCPVHHSHSNEVIMSSLCRRAHGQYQRLLTAAKQAKKIEQVGNFKFTTIWYLIFDNKKKPGKNQHDLLQLRGSPMLISGTVIHVLIT